MRGAIVESRERNESPLPQFARHTLCLNRNLAVLHRPCNADDLDVKKDRIRCPNPALPLLRYRHKTPRKKLAPAKSGHSRSGAGAIALQDWEGLAVLGGRLAQQRCTDCPVARRTVKQIR